MHSYQHNIKTFNNATRHLTHVERALYRDLIELYYDTEQPLPANDFDALCRRVLARTEDEKSAVKSILGEFFVLTGDVYSHDYCDEVIAKYKASVAGKATAGKASAESRKKKAAARKWSREQKANGNSTDVEQMLNGCSTDVLNQKPETRNQKPDKELKEFAQSPPAEAPSQTVVVLPTNRFATSGELFRVTEDMLPDWCAAYPAVAIQQELPKIKAWLMDNPTKRKTANGMRRFIGAWLSREQNRGGANKPSTPPPQRPSL